MMRSDWSEVMRPEIITTTRRCSRAERSILCARLEPGSGSGIGNKAIIISAEQQSHTEEYGVVHGSSNLTRRKNTAYCTWSE